MSSNADFDGFGVRDYPPLDHDDDHLVLSLSNYEGPLDLLVDLARTRKIDLTAISLLEIADQFLDWIRKATDLRLEVAGYWLVMAATLALLKSRILIPTAKEDKADAEAAIEDLASRLRRLDAIRSVVEELQGRRRLGINWHIPTQLDDEKGAAKRVDANLHSLLSAYAREARKSSAPAIIPVKNPFLVLSVEDAISYLRSSGILSKDWKPLMELMPPLKPVDIVHARSRIAASYVALLELGKQGLVEVRQIEGSPVIAARRRQEAGSSSDE